MERSLDDIVVTARKRDVAERAQDVPQALTAFSGAALAAAHVQDLTDVANLAPGVRLVSSGTVPGYGSFFIRGAGVAGSIPSNDPAVGTFINGMPLGISTASLTELFDLASVEVLRGPQGTLFGRNVTGGAILINTSRPDGSFHASLHGGLGSAGQQEIGGSVEGGTENGDIAAKLSFIVKHNDGFFNDLQSGRRVGLRNVQIVRPTVVLKPTDTLTIAATVEIGSDTGDGPISKNIAAVGTLVTTRGYVPPPGKFDVRLNDPGFNDLKWKHAIVNIDWDIGPGKITSITGFREVSQTQLTDTDGSPIEALNFNTNIDQHQFFQELRFAGAPFGTDAINITAGVSALDQKFNYSETRNILGGATKLALRGIVSHQQYGIFAQTDITLPWNLSATLGARYSYEKKAAQIASLGNCNFSLTTCTFDFNGKDHWGNFGPKAGLQWQPTKAFLAYASWTRGFRSGGYNVRNGSPAIPPGPYNEETVDAYEVGIKSEFFDRRLRVNLAGYVNKLSGLQEVVLDANSIQRVLNAADATVKGFEAELTAIPVHGLVLTGSVGYIDNRYDRFDGLDLTGDNIPDPALAKKLKFPQVPDWTASASATYEVDIGRYGRLTYRGSYSYVGAQPADVVNSFYLPSYDVLDASVSWAINNNVSVTVYGKNLTNSLYAGYGSKTTLAQQIFLSPPASWLAEIAFKF